MKRHATIPSVGSQTSRTGTTLSEVLVATFVMSIGVVSLATLFPIALLRSIQATQLTNATLLRQNAEARLEYNAGVIHDPDNDGNETEHRADIDVDNDGTIDAGIDTDWDSDNTVDLGAYLVDPLGRALSASNPNSLGLLTRFSGFGTAVPTIAQFETLCMLPDVWQPLFESRVAAQNNAAFTISIPSGIDLTNLTTSQVRNTANPNNPRYRMVLLDATGKSAVIKDLFQITDNAGTANDDLIWQDTTSPPTLSVPTGFTAAQVKVEVQERRYTWMLTVRKNSAGTAAVDVVAFFERSFRPQDEFVYGVTYSINSAGQATGNGFDGQPGNAGVDDNADGTTDEVAERGWPGSDDRRTISVTWTAGTDPNPFIKQGGFVLDAAAGNWYRITQYVENTTAGTATIVVDHDLTPLPSGITPRLVFFRGVLEVYPLGMRMTP